jgi:hypothetical protein
MLYKLIISYKPIKPVGTLILSILKSVHTLISPIFSYKLYSVATPKPLPLEDRVRLFWGHFGKAAKASIY